MLLLYQLYIGLDNFLVTCKLFSQLALEQLFVTIFMVSMRFSFLSEFFLHSSFKGWLPKKHFLIIFRNILDLVYEIGQMAMIPHRYNPL